jgi:hypothetical protein
MEPMYSHIYILSTPIYRYLQFFYIGLGGAVFCRLLSGCLYSMGVGGGFLHSTKQVHTNVLFLFLYIYVVSCITGYPRHIYINMHPLSLSYIYIKPFYMIRCFFARYGRIPLFYAGFGRLLAVFIHMLSYISKTYQKTTHKHTTNISKSLFFRKLGAKLPFEIRYAIAILVFPFFRSEVFLVAL